MIDATFLDTPRDGYTTRIDYEHTEHGPEARSVQVTSTEHPVTATVLRQVPVDRLMRQDQAVKTYATSSAEESYQHIHEVVGAAAEAAGGEDRARLVRDVYHDAFQSGTGPAKAVAASLGVSIATAGRRIRESKQLLGWS